MNTTNKRTFLLLLLTCMFCKNVWAIYDTTKVKKNNTIILLPLHLDSLFKYGGYKYGNNVPKFALSALEFYNGVQIAADSLREEGIDARIEVVDSKRHDAQTKLFANYNLHKPALVIGVMQNASELRSISGVSKQNNVPFISATYPNDGGVTQNPYLLIINSTLKTHCAALYKFLQKNNSSQNLLLITRSNGADERIKNYFVEAEKNASGKKLNWKMVSFTDTFTVGQLSKYLDSTRTNAIIGTSLDANFSQKIISAASHLKTSYKTAVYGMPTWDELNLSKPDYSGVDVYFSTPFVSYSANAALYMAIAQKFKKIANSRPSDMVYKGFEITYRYVKTLALHPDSFMEHINDPSGKVFADFNFEKVFFSTTDSPDYVENKKLYFIKKTDGEVKGVY